MNLLVITAAFVTAIFSFAACIPFYQKSQDGLQTEFASHVPARTAVLPCQTWHRVTLAPADQKLLCDRLDEAVMEGFRAQPYMRGFSPKVVSKLLDQGKWPAATAEGFGIVIEATRKSDCVTASNPLCGGSAAIYEQTLRNNAAWQMWLARFSDTQKHADAVLIPILVAATDERSNELGLVALSRSVNFSLWLIDTASGKMVWSRTKSGKDTVKALPEKSANLKVPEWNVPVTRALTQDFWRDYPGRIVLD